MVIGAWFLVLAARANAQIDTTISTVKEVLGYNAGEKYTNAAGIEKYLKTVREQAGKRMQLFSYGTTYEGRTLYLAFFSSPENIARLDSIKANIQLLADPRKITDAEAEKIIANTPAIVWLSYGVHGNEASPSEAALSMIYQLAAR
ncbi:MAG TPA: M14 family zinc carboxypeptidase, partial [Bacteroidota bacterium]|nr:M14 family zinc carboxypeptidase [Bacteroidota bacterium]